MAGTKKIATSKKGQEGFALLALVIVIAVLGILLSTHKPTKGGIVAGKYDETQRRLQIITQAMERYYTATGAYYPCPAERNAAESANTFGLATSCDAGCPTGNICATSGGSSVIIGAVPVRDLNLPEKYTYDAWNNRFVYAIDRRKVEGGSGNAILRIKSVAGTYMVNPPPYYLGSLGPDGVGAFTRAGNQQKACAGATAVSNNCSQTHEFLNDRWQTINSNVQGAVRNFDDVMANGSANSHYQCPAGIKGCKLWLDASDPTGEGDASTKPSNAATVETWVDKSGNGYNATQASAGLRPTYRTNVLNSRAVLRFDGVDDRLVNAVFKGTATSTIFAVAKLNPLADAGYKRLFNAGSNGVIFFGARSLQFATFYGDGTLWNEATDPNLPNIVNLTSPERFHVLSAVNDNRTNAFPYIGGYPQTGRTAATAAYTGFDISDYFAGGQGWHGDIAEVIVYDRALNDEERKQVECYLGAKYNLPSPCKCPAKIGGCLLWADASDPTTIRDSLNRDALHASFSGIVETWKDKSGYGYDFTRYSSSSAPTYAVGVADNAGRTYIADKVVTFTTAQGMSSQAEPANANWTVIGVGRLTTGSHSRMIQGVNNNWLMGTYGNTVSAAFYEGDVRLFGDSSNTKWYIHTGKANSSNSYIFSNTGQKAASANYKQAPHQIGLNVGPYSTGPHGTSELSTMQMAEVIVYNRALSNEDQRKVECYLAKKYGLASDIADATYNDIRANCN